MNNVDAEQLLNECQAELDSIKGLLNNLSPFDSIVPYLTKYALIKSSGTIEQSYKVIIADFCDHKQNQQVKTYIQNTFRNGSRNPSYENICKSLAEFDSTWNTDFKKQIGNKKNSGKLRTSLKSLNEARNEFAHGGSPNITFTSIYEYFDDATKIIEILDRIVD